MEKELCENIVFDDLVSVSPNAWCVSFDGRSVWLPKSKCSLDEAEGTVEVPMWLIKKLGLESYIED